MTNENLKYILDKHRKWINGENDGEYADLRGVSLNGVDLPSADLRGANLTAADLSGANLRGANLRGANLRWANLRWANLRRAELHGADLRWADLSGADLHRTNLGCADLCWANLRSAQLDCANLRGADLNGAVYRSTVLNLQCSEEGSFIAWKKLADENIAKLLIPEDAKRSSSTTRKCRASKAVVLAIYNKNGEEISEGRSGHDSRFIYRVGETVYPDDWDEDRWNECSSGIHFFITRKEAEEY